MAAQIPGLKQVHSVFGNINYGGLKHNSLYLGLVGDRASLCGKNSHNFCQKSLGPLLFSFDVKMGGDILGKYKFGPLVWETKIVIFVKNFPKTSYFNVYPFKNAFV